ncbi:MAG: hypothetical protein WKG00_28555 [Polyangiaceae bacterium]
MPRILAAALFGPLLGSLAIGACGGKVAVDDEPSGAGGGGSSGPGSPSSGPGSNPAGTGGMPGTSTATGIPGSGGSGLAAACEEACSAIANCMGGDCFGSCTNASSACNSEREAFLECIGELTDPSTCDMPDRCEFPLHELLICESWCPLQSWGASASGEGKCTGKAHTDCGLPVALEVSCEPSGGGLLSCACTSNGQVVGACVEEIDTALGCDPFQGCCATLFFVPG